MKCPLKIKKGTSDEVPGNAYKKASGLTLLAAEEPL